MYKYYWIILLIIVNYVELDGQISRGKVDCSKDKACVLNKLTSHPWIMKNKNHFLNAFETSYEKVVFEFDSNKKLKIRKVYKPGSPFMPIITTYNFEIVQLDELQYGVRIHKIDRCLSLENEDSSQYNSPQLVNCDFQDYVDVEFLYNAQKGTILLVVRGRDTGEASNEYNFKSF